MSEPLGVAGAGALTVAGIEDLVGRVARRVADAGRRLVDAGRRAAGRPQRVRP